MLDAARGVPTARAKYVDLVFEGGGIKGIGLIGALSVLEERGFQPQNVAGSSAGAIAATLLAAGYTAAELKRIMFEFDFAQLLDTAWEDAIPLAGSPLSILLDKGIYEGNALQEKVRELLEAKGVRTFRDLIHPAYADQPRYRYRVQVIASDITERRMLVLPRDAARLGVDPDDLDVALAVRMSASIPIFFEPVTFQNPRTGRDHLIVDGGMLSNFPVWLFDVEGEPDWPTFGLMLVEPSPKTPVGDRLAPRRTSRTRIGALVDYIWSIAQTMVEAHDRMYLEQDTFVRTIPIPTLGIRTTDFTLGEEQKERLYQAGRRVAMDFLATWDFDAYVEEYRRGKKHSRRATVLAQLHGAVSGSGDG